MGSKKNDSSTSGAMVAPGTHVGASAPVSAKSKRVRTGCLTCRERHLKCDEGIPDCLNCKKSNRECKRGVRLNFIDLTCKEPPHIPRTEEWSVQFQDESRLIASEYRGGLGMYPKLDQEIATSPDSDLDPSMPRQSLTVYKIATHTSGVHRTPSAILTPQSIYYTDRNQLALDQLSDGNHTRKNSDASFMGPPGSSHSTGFGNSLTDAFVLAKEVESRRNSQTYEDSDLSNVMSGAGLAGAEPHTTYRDGNGGSDKPGHRPDKGGMMTPPNDKKIERDYLSSPEELHFMQVFVTEVGVWMDSLDKEKHFSRLVPYHALKCPMLMNAVLACGVKHLTVTQQYNDDKALFYYNTATTQLLQSLRNPERNMAECAVTAVVLNVYEIMSEKPTQRMNHIAGARALIRECGWDATSTGLGSACFWLNVGMELLSCLAFNWQTAWDPDHWGVDMDFSTKKEHGQEEIWVHRIFHIVAKIANFRASIPRFQEPSPHDEQIRLQARFAEWQRLKNLCDTWNNECPRPMHPFGYLKPPMPQESSGPPRSLFPNVWLIKRAAVVGRLHYHTAQCLLAQINPILPKETEESRKVQLHHAHQVCGIVAHTKDRGVASVSIRSLAIVAEVLTNSQEQKEVISILENIDRETGWKLGGVLKNLKRIWGWEKSGGTGLAAQFLAHGGSGGNSGNSGQQQQNITQNTTQHGMTMPGMAQASQSVVVPRPMRNVNPLSFADFSLPNHPYQNWYEPPSRSNNYNSSQGFL